jgi:hypothetical protein
MACVRRWGVGDGGWLGSVGMVDQQARTTALSIASTARDCFGGGVPHCIPSLNPKTGLATRPRDSPTQSLDSKS